MRQKPPRIVTEWQERIREKMPRCCYMCWNYDLANNVCKKYNATPPDHYINEVNECQEYEETVPF